MSDRLSEIRERLARIIPGPWRWLGNTETNSVMLATADRGRLFIMDARTTSTEYVFDHDASEGYTLEVARNRIAEWCGHDGAHDACICDALRDFLAGSISPGDGEEHVFELGPVGPVLTRGVQTHPDLRFPDSSIGAVGSLERAERGGMMRSYRDTARYEVLGHCTREEFERRQQLVDQREPNRRHRPTAEEALYREDFCGLDQPEAEFIERAPEDIAWLVEKLDAAHGIIDDLSARLGAANSARAAIEEVLALSSPSFDAESLLARIGRMEIILRRGVRP